MNLTVLPMTEDYLESVMSIEIASFSEPWSPWAFLSDMRYNRAATYEIILSDDDEVIGYSGWWALPDRLEILKVAVREDCRRMGVGKRLIQRALIAAREHGIENVTLMVEETNHSALTLYDSLGFSCLGRIPLYYRFSDGLYYQLILEKTAVQL